MYNKLVAGSSEIDVISLLGGPAVHEGITVDSIRIILPADITEEQITDLIEHPWNLYTPDGHFLKTYTGYNTVAEYSLTIYKVPEVTRYLVELDKAGEEINTARALAESKTAEAEAAVKRADEADRKFQEADASIKALQAESEEKGRIAQSAINNALEMQKNVQHMSEQLQMVSDALQFAGININSLMEARSMAHQDTKTTA